MATRKPLCADPVALAAIDALLAARWACAEHLSRKPAALAIELLRGHAAELAYLFPSFGVKHWYVDQPREWNTPENFTINFLISSGGM